MKIYVMQMYSYNCYAYRADDVPEEHWDYFTSSLWWQVGSSFIKPYDNVKDFPYCAENFSKYGETAVRQQLKLVPAPWEKALDRLLPEMEALGVDFYLHGSAAMALHGIDITPKDINIIIPNSSDFDKVREHFHKLAIKPFERCDNWLMSGLGEIFLDAVIGFSFHNKELEPYDMSVLSKAEYHGYTLCLSTLEMLRQDNISFNRPERVTLIEERM